MFKPDSEAALSIVTYHHQTRRAEELFWMGVTNVEVPTKFDGVLKKVMAGEEPMFIKEGIKNKLPLLNFKIGLEKDKPPTMDSARKEKEKE